MKMFERILFATDLTPASRPAFKEAVGLASQNDAELIIAHAYQPPNLSEAEAVAPNYEQWIRNLRDEAENLVAPLVEEAKKSGAKVRTLVVEGKPGEAIADGAKKNSADLVVMGTHGRKGVPRLFLGSVASHVITTATCPVMTVRAA